MDPVQVRAGSGQATTCRNILRSLAKKATNDVELEYS